MRAFAIVIKDHPISESGFSELVRSSKSVGNDAVIDRFDAVVPEQVESQMKAHKLQWNYPSKGSVLDPWSELRKTAYGERNPLRRVACSLSHYNLWKKTIELDEPLMILEHDALFVKKVDEASLVGSSFGVIGINSPFHATFAFDRYHQMIQQNKQEVQPVPMLASKEIPQGLAGNSAYIIKPFAAKHLIQLCHKYGLWPNDAIMCQQLCTFLGVSKTYYTQVQGLKSTTTL